MVVEIVNITKFGHWKTWEIIVLGRKVEVAKKDNEDIRILDLALFFALQDSNLSEDVFTTPISTSSIGDRIIISSIPLSVSMCFCNRRLDASLLNKIGLAHRELDIYNTDKSR